MTQRKTATAMAAVAAMLGIATTAVAGEPGVSASAGLLRPGPPPLERFVGPLSLSAAQQAKLRPIFEAAQRQAEQDVKDAASEGRKPDQAQLEATWRMHDADFRMRLANVLTPEQLTKYEQMTADRTPREQAGEMHGAHGHRESDTPATASERDDQGTKPRDR
jgi:Spy/CpxP family protein refolding chaperone